MKSKNIKYLQSLDHVRFFASALIILYHGFLLYYCKIKFDAPVDGKLLPKTNNPFFALIMEGHTAVAMFMVLSGFLFTLGAHKREISYFGFIKNRFLRTYPLYLFMVLMGISIFPESFGFLPLFQNLFFLSNYSGAMSAGGFLAMSWAIAVEWQFYLIFPFLIVFADRYGFKYLIGLILLFTVFRIVAFLSAADIKDVAYWTILGRMDQFLVGMIAALIYLRIELRLHKIKRGTSILFLVLSIFILLLSISIYNQAGGWLEIHPFKIYWTTIEGVMWAVFIVAYIQSSNLIPSFLSRIFVSLGTISYSLYLTHFVVLVTLIKNDYLFKFLNDAVSNSFFNVFLVLLPVTVGLSYATFYLIEKPFMDLRVKYTRDA